MLQRKEVSCQWEMPEDERREVGCQWESRDERREVGCQWEMPEDERREVGCQWESREESWDASFQLDLLTQQLSWRHAPCTAAWKCLSVRADEPRGCTLLQHCIAQKTTRSSSVHLLCTSHRPSPLPTMPHETNNPHHADTPLSSPLPSMPLFGVCPSAGQSCEASPPPPPGLIAPLSPRLAEEEEEEEGLRKHGHEECFHGKQDSTMGPEKKRKRHQVTEWRVHACNMCDDKPTVKLTKRTTEKMHCTAGRPGSSAHRQERKINDDEQEHSLPIWQHHVFHPGDSETPKRGVHKCLIKTERPKEIAEEEDKEGEQKDEEAGVMKRKKGKLEERRCLGEESMITTRTEEEKDELLAMKRKEKDEELEDRRCQQEELVVKEEKQDVVKRLKITTEELELAWRPRRRSVGPPIRYLIQSEEESQKRSAANQRRAKGRKTCQEKDELLLTNRGEGEEWRCRPGEDESMLMKRKEKEEESVMIKRKEEEEESVMTKSVMIKRKEEEEESVMIKGKEEEELEERRCQQEESLLMEVKKDAVKHLKITTGESELATRSWRRSVGPPIRYLIESEEESQKRSAANQRRAKGRKTCQEKDELLLTNRGEGEEWRCRPGEDESMMKRKEKEEESVMIKRKEEEEESVMIKGKEEEELEERRCQQEKSLLMEVKKDAVKHLKITTGESELASRSWRRSVGPPIRYLIESEEGSHGCPAANQSRVKGVKGKRLIREEEVPQQRSEQKKEEHETTEQGPDQDKLVERTGGEDKDQEEDQEQVSTTGKICRTGRRPGSSAHRRRRKINEDKDEHSRPVWQHQNLHLRDSETPQGDVHKSLIKTERPGAQIQCTRSKETDEKQDEEEQEANRVGVMKKKTRGLEKRRFWEEEEPVVMKRNEEQKEELEEERRCQQVEEESVLTEVKQVGVGVKRLTITTEESELVTRPRRRSVGPPIRYLIESEEGSHGCPAANQSRAKVVKVKRLIREEEEKWMERGQRGTVECIRTTGSSRMVSSPDGGAEERCLCQEGENEGYRKEDKQMQEHPWRPIRKVVDPPIRYLLESDEQSHDSLTANLDKSMAVNQKPQRTSQTEGGASKDTAMIDSSEDIDGQTGHMVKGRPTCTTNQDTVNSTNEETGYLNKGVFNGVAGGGASLQPKPTDMWAGRQTGARRWVYLVYRDLQSNHVTVISPCFVRLQRLL